MPAMTKTHGKPPASLLRELVCHRRTLLLKKAGNDYDDVQPTSSPNTLEWREAPERIRLSECRTLRQFMVANRRVSEFPWKKTCQAILHKRWNSGRHGEALAMDEIQARMSKINASPALWRLYHFTARRKAPLKFQELKYGIKGGDLSKEIAALKMEITLDNACEVWEKLFSAVLEDEEGQFKLEQLRERQRLKEAHIHKMREARDRQTTEAA